MAKIYYASRTAPVNIAKDLRTLTTASCSEGFERDELWLNGQPHSLDTPRTQQCLRDLRKHREELEAQDGSLPKLSKMHLHIVSENNFPTAAGLASSAAGFAALISAVAKLYELPQSASDLSKIARKGSGSACRSLFGGYVAWEMGELENGEDSKAVEVAPLSHWPDMKACILVVSDDKKDVPSTSGMQLTVKTSSLFQHRVEKVVPQRFEEMKKSIREKNFPLFAELTMKDSNSFHATCLDSYPPIFYLNDTSKKIIKLINLLNESAGKIIAAYTFDAGPNAVIYYEQKNESRVLGLLHALFKSVDGWQKIDPETLTPPSIELDPTWGSGVSRVILTEVGAGPQDSDEVLINVETGLPK
ncbi:hypothetical protein KL933_003092 [Ogataea haglerorum]|uniref:Diphosphomevalonate decarboxylase n=1 Tax=Ogataea haglerorum TaxID=1937702 RepID=A0AAN6D5Q9_9ASCO|nr:uncharacterized protein KL911_000653 [Ogataea haglerorum]KAG7701069.1 hypothetical protein KL915_000100 [Ogataea haglerorum]KAG7706025.1 hypothetical protein KL950_003601 [Ogataea haglerorum]KAG7709027.1 hypothetical protein KL914_001417 [Ogataea haglerorum]KAG7725632.1 hypothetical protein KL948_004816 [Ogataea haglerorum]KAG7726809.1 hypothetical protein KL933_003092 [Ogataea haglerorum]